MPTRSQADIQNGHLREDERVQVNLPSKRVSRALLRADRADRARVIVLSTLGSFGHVREYKTTRIPESSRDRHVCFNVYETPAMPARSHDPSI